MPNISTGNTTIPYGSSLRIGYRIYGSSGAFTYLTTYPSYNELPYTFTVPTSGTWEVEYTTICPNCSGNSFSAGETAVVVV